MITQFIEREVGVGFEVGFKFGQAFVIEAGRVSAAVRFRGEIRALSVQSEHLLNEGRTDAEELSNFGDGAIAAQVGSNNTLA